MGSIDPNVVMVDQILRLSVLYVFQFGVQAVCFGLVALAVVKATAKRKR